LTSTILKGRKKNKNNAPQSYCLNYNVFFVNQLPVTKQNRFLPITIDEQQGLNKHHESRVIIAAVKTLIIRVIIAKNNKIINGRLPDSQPVFMTHISD